MENSVPDMTIPARAHGPDTPGSVRALRRRSKADHRTEAAPPALALEPLLARLERRYGDRITAHRVAPARAAKFAPFPDDLDPALRRALGVRGIESLYTHQRVAWDSVRAGAHTVVVTPTTAKKMVSAS